ncbi:MAG: histidine phosphatase family protein [Actinomycetaceae bacterium]|nr:histidine phosphatase family protein [Actinomycetaceae bacterium]
MSSSKPVSRIVFVRHGQTDFNAGGRVQGQIDIPLNEEGRAQARAMGPVVAALEPTLVVVSDLSRAVDTAAEIVRHVDVPLVLDERIRERDFGVFEGMSRDEMVAQHPNWFDEWRTTGDCTSAGVETRVAVGERFAEAVLEHVAGEPGTYVFVSHGSAITQAMTQLLGLSPDSWAGLRGPDNCHWSILERASRFPNWRVVAHNVGA